jgi:hypothetical protein
VLVSFSFLEFYISPDTERKRIKGKTIELASKKKLVKSSRKKLVKQRQAERKRKLQQ